MTTSSVPNLVILGFNHILLIQIESAKFEPWSGPPPQRRIVHLQIQLKETLLGQTRQKEGDHIPATVEQFEVEAFWSMMNVPGIWSRISLVPGTRLVIFASSPFNDVPELMIEPQCRAISYADEALTGVRLAIGAESGKMRLADLLRNAISVADSLDYVFVEYLSTRLSDPALVPPETFDLLMALLDHPKLPLTTRSALLTAIFDETMRSTTFSDIDINSFAIAMFHLLALAEAQPLHNNIATVYLPNLLGLSGGVELRSADLVFHDRPDERQKVGRILESWSGDGADTLRHWLQ